jgi:hypothetical protein
MADEMDSVLERVAQLERDRDELEKNRQARSCQGELDMHCGQCNLRYQSNPRRPATGCPACHNREEYLRADHARRKIEEDLRQAKGTAARFKAVADRRAEDVSRLQDQLVEVRCKLLKAEADLAVDREFPAAIKAETMASVLRGLAKLLEEGTQ